MKRINNVKKYIFLLIVIFIVPVVIQILYKIPALHKYLETVYSAGDVLSYFGSIIGAVCTIWAIVLTINFTKENQKEERKLSIKPVLETSHHPIFDAERFLRFENEQITFLYYPHDEEERVSSSIVLPSCMKKYAKLCTEIDKSFANKIMPKQESLDFVNSFFKKYYIIQYEIFNAGGGTAISIFMKINNYFAIPTFSIPSNSTQKFVLFLESSLLHGNEREISFTYEYSDIAQIGHYKQQEIICLFREANDSLSTRHEIKGFLTYPEEINK